MTQKIGQAGAMLNCNESLAEKFDHLAGGLAHIQQSWDNRLSAKNILLWEGYLKGDYGILIKFDRIVAGDNAFSIGESAICYLPRHVASFETQRSTVNTDCGDEQIVLVDLIQLCDGPKEVVAATVAVRPYLIEDKTFGVGEGLLYRSLINNVFAVFPSFVERKTSEFDPGLVPIFRQRRSQSESRPKMVASGAEVVNSISNYQRDHSSLGSEVSEIQRPLVRLFTDGQSVGFCSLNFGHQDFKLVDVAIGPYNL